MKKLIEDYLQRNHASSAANGAINILEALRGEKIRAVLRSSTVLIDETLSVYIFVFESGNTFTFNSNGSYYINDKNTSENQIRNELKRTEVAHAEHEAILELLPPKTP